MWNFREHCEAMWIGRRVHGELYMSMWVIRSEHSYLLYPAFWVGVCRSMEVESDLIDLATKYTVKITYTVRVVALNDRGQIAKVKLPDKRWILPQEAIKEKNRITGGVICDKNMILTTSCYIPEVVAQEPKFQVECRGIENFAWASIYKIDRGQGLMLLKMDDEFEFSEFIRIVEVNCDTDSSIRFLHHPVYLDFSYAASIVAFSKRKFGEVRGSVIREATRLPALHDETQLVQLIPAGVDKYSLGSPIFDGNGKVAGILSFHLDESLCFAIHTSEIVEFMRRDCHDWKRTFKVCSQDLMRIVTDPNSPRAILKV